MGTIESKTITSKSGREFTLRNVSVDDSQEIVNFWNETVKEVEFHVQSPEEAAKRTHEQRKEWIEKQIKLPGDLAFVLTFEDKIIAMVSAHCHELKRLQHVVWFDINIIKEFQGDGLGPLMMAEFIEWAKSNEQIEKIGLCTHSTNERAIHLYKKLGFKEEGRRVKDIKYDDHYADTVTMGMFV